MNYSDRDLLKLSVQTHGSTFRGFGEQIYEAYEQEDYERVNRLLADAQLLQDTMQLINNRLKQKKSDIKNAYKKIE